MYRRVGGNVVSIYELAYAVRCKLTRRGFRTKASSIERSSACGISDDLCDKSQVPQSITMAWSGGMAGLTHDVYHLHKKRIRLPGLLTVWRCWRAMPVKDSVRKIHWTHEYSRIPGDCSMSDGTRQCARALLSLSTMNLNRRGCLLWLSRHESVNLVWTSIKS